jgi:hypothetical protein
MSPQHRWRIATPLLAALLITGCGPEPDTQIGIRASALDLQFARPDLAVPVPPRIIVRLLPAPQVVLDRIIRPGKPAPLPPVPTTPPTPVGCPAAATPGKPLAEAITGSPKAGYYTYATKGTGTVTGGVGPVSAALPTTTSVAVTEGQLEPVSQTIDAEGGAPASGKQLEYSVTTLLSKTVRQVDTYRLSATSLNLVKREVSNAERSFEIKLTPHVQVMVFGPVGTRWSSRGTDSDTAASLDYAGTIEAVSDVKVCGVVTKAYRVAYQSTLTNPTGFEVIRSGTSADHPASFTIAPQLGGLLLSQQVYSEDLRLYSDLGGYVQTTLDYRSDLTDLTPASEAGPL